MPRRVVITGRGIVSCIGNHLDEVAAALKAGRSGIRRAPEFAEAGLRSQIAGIPALDSLPAVPRALRRFMADTALYAYHAASAAITEARLDSGLLASSRTALIVGSGVSSSLEIADNVALARSGGARKVLPYAVPRLMGSTTSANLATAFGVRGPSYSIVSACASSSHSIGHGAELIQLGKAERVIAGGAEEASWTTALMFDAMGALSSGYNDRPQAASRPYEARRGYRRARGAGERARARRAPARRAGRLRHILGRRGHGRAERRWHRMRDARRARRGARLDDRLHQYACHFHAERRPGGAQGAARRVRRAPAALLVHQGPHGSRDRRQRRAGKHLLPADDGAWLRRRVGEPRGSRPGP